MRPKVKPWLNSRNAVWLTSDLQLKRIKTSFSQFVEKASKYCIEFDPKVAFNIRHKLRIAIYWSMNSTLLCFRSINFLTRPILRIISKFIDPRNLCSFISALLFRSLYFIRTTHSRFPFYCIGYQRLSTFLSSREIRPLSPSVDVSSSFLLKIFPFKNLLLLRKWIDW